MQILLCSFTHNRYSILKNLNRRSKMDLGSQLLPRTMRYTVRHGIGIRSSHGGFCVVSTACLGTIRKKTHNIWRLLLGAFFYFELFGRMIGLTFKSLHFSPHNLFKAILKDLGEEGWLWINAGFTLTTSPTGALIIPLAEVFLAEDIICNKIHTDKILKGNDRNTGTSEMKPAHGECDQHSSFNCS